MSSWRSITAISELCLCPERCTGVCQIKNAHNTLHTGFGINKKGTQQEIVYSVAWQQCWTLSS